MGWTLHELDFYHLVFRKKKPMDVLLWMSILCLICFFYWDNLCKHMKQNTPNTHHPPYVVWYDIWLEVFVITSSETLSSKDHDCGHGHQHGLSHDHGSVSKKIRIQVGADSGGRDGKIRSFPRLLQLGYLYHKNIVTPNEGF